MKTVVTPLVCGVALAAMAGAVSSHYAAVTQMTTWAANPEIQDTLHKNSSQKNTKSMIAQLQRENHALMGTLHSSQEDLESRLSGVAGDHAAPRTSDRLETLLAELVAQNRDLKNQIAETNRELMDVQFRLDTHAEGFRPLNVANETIAEAYPTIADDGNFDIAPGLLPPMEN